MRLTIVQLAYDCQACSFKTKTMLISPPAFREPAVQRFRNPGHPVVSVSGDHVHILELNGESYRLRDSKQKRPSQPSP
jgi:hypothetical protein